MRNIRVVTIVVQVLILAVWVASVAFGAERERVFCGKNHHIAIEDLDMSPDPLNRGERVQNWRIRVRVDGSGECDTLFEIREKGSDAVVARGSRHVLHPGVNEITLPGGQGYRMSRHEHCFQVLADIENTRKHVDSKETFCARERDSGKRFSMRERGDRPMPH
jgi:hypothetical protein